MVQTGAPPALSVLALRNPSYVALDINGHLSCVDLALKLHAVWLTCRCTQLSLCAQCEGFTECSCASSCQLPRENHLCFHHQAWALLILELQTVCTCIINCHVHYKDVLRFIHFCKVFQSDNCAKMCLFSFPNKEYLIVSSLGLLGINPLQTFCLQ